MFEYKSGSNYLSHNATSASDLFLRDICNCLHSLIKNRKVQFCVFERLILS